jgi:hypothetical protein
MTGLKDIKKSGFEGAVGSPVAKSEIILSTESEKCIIYQYDLSDPAVAKLIKEGKSTGKFPVMKMMDTYYYEKGYANGPLVITGYNSSYKFDEFLKLFQSYKP